MVDFSALGTFAQERSQGYWLLSRLFLQAPDAPHLLQLQADLATAEDCVPLDELRRVVDDCLSAPEAAAIEFSRRLVMVCKASGEELPYESFVREGTIPGEVTNLVEACMRDAGFADIATAAPSPDHIGAELKFMAMLCYEESKAWGSRMQVRARRRIVMQRYFLSRHVGSWAPEYCERLEERAEHDYIRTVARLTRRCLITEVAAVEELHLRFNSPDASGAFAKVRPAMSD